MARLSKGCVKIMTVEKFLNGMDRKEFQSILEDNKFVVVDVFAEWCGPCKTMGPVFEELSEEFKQIKFVTIDSDNCNWINAEFSIDSIPRFLLFEETKMIHEIKGAIPKSTFAFILKEKLLKESFDKFYDFSGLSEDELKAKLNKEWAVLYIYKKGSMLNDIFKPLFVNYSEEYEDILFAEIDYHKTQWLKDTYGIKDMEYERYGDPDKKLPYFLFFKNGELYKETGPIQSFDDIIKGDILHLFKVDEYEQGISKEDFDKILSENPYVAVDIFTEWCSPCKFMKPIFQDLSSKYDQVKFISVDLDHTPWLGAHEEWGTNAIPTFLFFKEGKMAEKKVGGMSKEDFEKIIKEKLLKK